LQLVICTSATSLNTGRLAR